jgi:hypothetical protein
MRPTEYDPSYCDKVIEFGRMGKSKTWMAAELGVTKQTVLNWEKVHPEFFDAMTRALQYSQQWWEDKGQENIEKPVFQASMWSRSMAARFPDEWREATKSEVDLNGKIAVTEIKRTIVDPRNPDA